jgi:DGQHR domain-containing protein
VSYRGGHLNRGNHDREIVTLDLPDDATLWIVDGQHRVYGLDRAIKEFDLGYLNDFILPVVIVEFASIEDEANQFRIINETMKKVRTDLARRILALRAAGLGREGRRELRQSGRLWEANAVEVLKILSTDEASPWVDRIQSPNSRKSPHQVVRELSFTTSLKPILTEKPYRLLTPEQVAKLLIAYWRAWQSLVPEAFEDPLDYVLMKTPGVFSLHELAYYVLEVLRARDIPRPTEDDFRDILKDLGEYVTAPYWTKHNEHGAAMAGSMKGFSILADAMQEELELAGHGLE